MPGDYLPPVVGLLRLDNAQFMAATRESGVAMRKTQAEGKGAYATLGAGAEKALKAISVASGIAAVASIALATKFDSAMERVHTQAGAAQAEVEKMGPAMLDLAPKVGTGPEALAESLFHVESVGLRGAKALDTVAASAKLAKIGNADLEQTTNAVAAAFVTQMKDATSLNQIVGLLNATIGQGNMKMNDLTAAISTGILPVAKNFGLGLADIGGALAVMTDRGMHADEAATRLKMTMTMMEAPTAKAGKALHSVGLSSTSLAEDMHKPEGLLVALTDLKSHMDKAGLSAIKQAQVISAVFGGGRSSAGVQTLMNNLTVLDQKTKGVTAGVDKFGEAWAKTQRTAKFQWDQLKASMESAGVKLGNVLLPSVLRIAGAVGKLADAFAHLPSGIQGTIVTVGLLAYPISKVTRAILAGRDAWIAWRAAAVAAEASGAEAGAVGAASGAATAAGGVAAKATGIGAVLAGFAGTFTLSERAIKDNVSTWDEFRHSLGATVPAIDRARAAQAADAKATVDLTRAYQPANAALLTGQHRALGLGDAMRKAGDGSKVATSALHAQHPAMVTIKNDVEKAIPLFGGVQRASQVSANTILGNLREERNQFRTWAADTRTLLHRGLDPSIVQALSNQGPGYVHAFVSASDRKLAELRGVFKERSDAAGDAAKIELVRKGAQAGQAAARAMEANFHPVLVPIISAAQMAANPRAGQVARNAFAGGGVLREPVVGVGLRSGEGYTLAESGPEAVTPLGGHGSGRGGGGGGGGGGMTVNVYVSAGGILLGTPQEVARKLVQPLRQELAQTGLRNSSVLTGGKVKA